MYTKNLSVPINLFKKKVNVNYTEISDARLYHKGKLVRDADVSFKDKKGKEWWRGTIPLSMIHNKKVKKKIKLIRG